MNHVELPVLNRPAVAISSCWRLCFLHCFSDLLLSGQSLCAPPRMVTSPAAKFVRRRMIVRTAARSCDNSFALVTKDSAADVHMVNYRSDLFISHDSSGFDSLHNGLTIKPQAARASLFVKRNRCAAWRLHRR